MAVTIAETSGHVTETVLKSPLSPPVTMRRNDRSHSPKYAWSARRQRRSKAPGTGVVLKRVRPQTQARRAATHRADIVRRCTRVPRDRCSCGSPKATAAKRQQHGNTAPVDDDLGRKDSRIRKPRLHGAPHLVRHHVCLSVCLLWSDGSIRQVARGGCAVAERPAAQHPGASWALRAPPFIYSPQGGEHFDHCC